MGKVVELEAGLKPSKVMQTKILSMQQILDKFTRDLEKDIPKQHQSISSMKPIVGSKDIGDMGIGDFGFFSVIYECSKNHWGLRTKPDDWWYTILRTIWTQLAKFSANKNVQDLILQKNQNFWVFKDDSSIEQNPIVIDISGDVNFPYGIEKDYNHEEFFGRLSNHIETNITNKEYSNSVGKAFSTTKREENIAANLIALTSEVKKDEYDYCLSMAFGIPYVEMEGIENDWKELKEKVLRIKQFLAPIEEIIGVKDWWKRIEAVCDNLLDTYTGNVNKSWWKRILTTSEPVYPIKSCSIPYDGWFFTDVLRHEDLKTCPCLQSSIVTVPLVINHNERNSNAVLVSGMAGIKVNQSKDIPSVEARHGWALFVGQQSGYLYANHLVIQGQKTQNSLT